MQSIDDVDQQLRNWARWARDDDPHLGVDEPSAFRDYRASAAWDPGWGDPSAPPPIAPPIDERAALAMERLLVRVNWRTFRLLHRHYYLRAPQPELELQAALRTVLDVAHREPIHKLRLDAA